LEGEEGRREDDGPLPASAGSRSMVGRMGPTNAKRKRGKRNAEGTAAEKGEGRGVAAAGREYTKRGVQSRLYGNNTSVV